jgi:competence protein ComEA
VELHSDSIQNSFQQRELAQQPDRAPNLAPDLAPGRGVRMRVGLGAGVVLVLVAATVAVAISAVSAHPAAASAAGYSSDASVSATSTAAPAAAQAGQSDGATASTAFVQVVGQVRKPGLYELPAGDRIVDAVAAAGGFTPKADQASLNLAQVIADGQQIVVGVKGATPSAVGSTSSAAGTGIVDINTADATALETLDGIGPALAQRILAYRTAHGGFRSVGDLQNVTGIGPKKFAAIKGSVST